MRWQLLGDWPVSQFVIPSGTIIDLDVSKEWNGTIIPLPMPLNAKCLDQAAYEQMVAWYEPLTDDFLHLLQYARGIQPVNRSALP